MPTKGISVKGDRPVHSAAPKGFKGEKQIDGNETTMLPRPTKGPLQDRPPVPPRAADSGIERSMAALADKHHKRRSGY